MIDRPIKLFISYAEQDGPYLDELMKHLSALQRKRVVECWHNRCVRAGDDVAIAARERLESADIIIVIASPDYVASDDKHDVELSRALARHAEGSSRVIPLLVRPVDWKATELRRLQPLPKNETPVSIWQNRDEVWLEVVRGIEEVVNERRQGLLLVAENKTLREQMERLSRSEHDLAERCAKQERELESHRANHRQFDTEVEKFCATQRSEARAAQAQVSELTSQLGNLHQERQSQRDLIDRLSSQRQELQSLVNRLRDELKDAKSRIDLLMWQSESQITLLSGGVERAPLDKLTVSWSFRAANTGKTTVRLTRADVVWCFFPEDETSTGPVDINKHPEVLDFAGGLILAPGQVSESYMLTVDTRTLDKDNAKYLVEFIQPRLRVIFVGIDIQYRSFAESILDRERQV